jgi:hypothetical protein
MEASGATEAKEAEMEARTAQLAWPKTNLQNALQTHKKRAFHVRLSEG